MAFAKRKFARAGKGIVEGRYHAPEAPGAVRSPQNPGQVPDRSTVPEEGVLPVPPVVEGVRRPLTQYDSAQEIMGVYDKNDLDPTDPARFEQAPPSDEEQRKAFAGTLRTPMRPEPGYALAAGTRMAREELARLNAGAEEQADRSVNSAGESGV